MPTLGVCGDNCDQCPRGIATRTGDAKLLEETLALWIRSGLRPAGTPAESLLCNGCARSGACAYSEQRSCAIGRHIGNCGMCDDYPCAAAKKAFHQSDELAARCRETCGPDDFRRMEAAFFRKKQNLDAVNRRRGA
jgi:Protein of unknown function (DUF3795)